MQTSFEHLVPNLLTPPWPCLQLLPKTDALLCLWHPTQIYESKNKNHLILSYIKNTSLSFSFFFASVFPPLLVEDFAGILISYPVDYTTPLHENSKLNKQMLNMSSKYKKFCPLNVDGPLITHKDDHFAKICIKIVWKIRKFKLCNSAFVCPFRLSLSLKPLEIGETCWHISTTGSSQLN